MGMAAAVMIRLIQDLYESTVITKLSNLLESSQNRQGKKSTPKSQVPQHRVSNSRGLLGSHVLYHPKIKTTKLKERDLRLQKRKNMPRASHI